MRATPNRAISDNEAVCIRVTLERAQTIAQAPTLVPTIWALRVVSRCECGCASVDFATDSAGRAQPIADGIGKTARGGDVGIIVWGTESAISGLEVYDLGAGDDDLGLPELNSIASWGGAT